VFSKREDKEAAEREQCTMTLNSSEYQLLCVVGLILLVLLFFVVATVYYFVYGRFLGDGPMERQSTSKDNEVAIFKKKPAKHSFRRACLKKFLTAVLGKNSKEVMLFLDNGFPHEVRLLFELLVLTMLIFYVDLALDLQALLTFTQTGDRFFFLTNLSAIVVAALYTAFHIFDKGERLLADLSHTEIFALGISYVFQLHIVYLCWISWKRGKKHQLLIDAKFAEAAIEAVVSALVQTYAVVFRCDELENHQELTLYISILGSLASISSAFTLFDGPNGIDEAPGNEQRIISPKLAIVNSFRLCELTNKIGALALFQLATRPFGGAIMVAADSVVMAGLIRHYRGQVRFMPPCVFALMNPMLEKHNAVAMPHRVYYSLRAIELIAMLGVASAWTYYRKDASSLDELGRIFYEMYSTRLPVVLALLLSTVGMFALLPVVRAGLAIEGIMEYTREEWARKPFSKAQRKIRDATLAHAGEKVDKVADLMNAGAQMAGEVCKSMNLVNVNAFMERTGESAVGAVQLDPPPLIVMTKMLHLMYNSPLHRGKPDLRKTLMKYTLDTLVAHPALMAETFVRTRGMHVLASLTLIDCALCTEGLESSLDQNICELFIGGGCKLVRQLNTTQLLELRASQLPRALCATVLEDEDNRLLGKREPMPISDKRQVCLTLANLYSCAKQLNFTSEGMQALLHGALQDKEALEPMLVCPRLLLDVIDEPEIRAHLPDAAAPCMHLTYRILKVLDKQLKAEDATNRVEDARTVAPRGTSDPTTKLLENPHEGRGVGDYVLAGAKACLELIAVLVREMPRASVAGSFRTLAKLVQEQQNTNLGPVQVRNKLAKDLKIILGTKDKIEYLPLAFQDGVDPSQKLPGTSVPLLHSAIEGYCDRSARALFRAGAARLAADEIGRTAFHVAIQVGSDHLLSELQIDKSQSDAQAQNSICCGGATYSSIATEETDIEVGGARPSQIRCLELKKDPKGQPLQAMGTHSKNTNRKESVAAKEDSPKVKVGRWRMPNDQELLVRVRHGYLVASKLSGTEVWRLPNHLEAGKSVEVHSWTKGQEAWWKEQIPKGDSNQEEARVGAGDPDLAQALSLDHMVVCGVPIYFCQWPTEKYEKSVIFTGKTMLFDGRGDTTQSGYDWVSVYGQEVITNGLRYFEYTVHKVKCNTYVGIVAANSAEITKFGEHRGAAWSVQFKPQHRMQVGLKFELKKTEQLTEYETVPPDVRIGVLVDMDRRAVQFYIDDIRKGAVCQGLPDAVKLHVCLDSEGDRVSLIEKPVTRGQYEEMEKEFTEAVEVQQPETWQCVSCLTEHQTRSAVPADDAKEVDTFVKGWLYDQGSTAICEGCRTGSGPMSDGVTALSLAVAYMDPNEEVEDAGASALWAMNISECYSKKQVGEAILFACLADNSPAANRLLQRFNEYPRRYSRPPTCYIGRFSKGRFDPTPWSLQDMAMVALHVSIFAARKDTVEMLVDFFAKHLEDNMFEATAPKFTVELNREKKQATAMSFRGLALPEKTEEYSDDPWFKNKQYSVLNAALCSIYATRREFLPHEHDTFPRFGAEPRPCSMCGFSRAELHSASTKYAECALCAPLINKPHRDKEDDLTKMVAILLEKWVKSSQVTQGNATGLPWDKHIIGKEIVWPSLDGDLVTLPPRRDRKNGLSQLLETTVKVLEIRDGKEATLDIDEVKKELQVDEELLKAQEKEKGEGEETEEEEEEEDEDEGHEEVDYESKEIDFIVVDVKGLPPGAQWARHKVVQLISGAQGLRPEEVMELCQAVDGKGSRMELKLVDRNTTFPVRVRFTWQVLTGIAVSPLKFDVGCNPFHFAAALKSAQQLDMMIRVAIKDAEKFEVVIHAPTDPSVKWWTLVGKELEERAQRDEVEVDTLRGSLTVRNKSGALLRYDPTGANQRNEEDQFDEETVSSGSDQEDDGIFARSNRTDGEFRGTSETARTEYPLKLSFGELPFNKKAGGNAQQGKPGSSGMTPLHVAACHNRPTNVQILLDNGAKPAPANDAGFIPLMYALKFRFDEVASRLIAAMTLEDPKLLNAVDLAECTAMHYAADAGQMAAAALRQLLQSRADPVAKARNGTTPLLMAVSRSRLEAVKLLLQENSEWYPEVRSAIDFYGDVEQHTPLLAAVKADDRDIATALVRAKADVNKHSKGTKRRPIDAAMSESMCKILCSTRQLELTRNGDDPALEAPGSTGIGATIFAHLLRKRRGVKMAEVVLTSVGLQRCIDAMRDSTTEPDPLEVEFFLDQISTSMQRASDEARGKAFARVTNSLMGRLSADVRLHILSKTLMLCTRRPVTFSREVQVSYLCTLGVDRVESMASAIKRNKMKLFWAMMDMDEKLRNQLQAHPTVVDAMKKAQKGQRQDTMGALLSWLVPKEKYTEMEKTLKSGAPTTQLANYKNALGKELQRREDIAKAEKEKDKKAKQEEAEAEAARLAKQAPKGKAEAKPAPAPMVATPSSSRGMEDDESDIGDDEELDEDELLHQLRAQGLEVPSDSEEE